MKSISKLFSVLIIVFFAFFISCEKGNHENRFKDNDYLSVNMDISIVAKNFNLQNDSIIDVINLEINNISNSEIRNTLTEKFRNYIDNYKEIKRYFSDLKIAFNQFSEVNHQLLLDSLNWNAKSELNETSLFFLHLQGAEDTVNARLLKYRLNSFNLNSYSIINDSLFFKNGILNESLISLINTDDHPYEENLDPHLKYWETFRFYRVSMNYAKFEINLLSRDVLLMTNSILRTYLSKVRLLITVTNLTHTQ
ncbi:MAG: hypothetical protein CVU05_12015 [Bacteroidetes bacterium HGW-Bacteroidetes-21]|jgi:hypothetical protein|nr:MAG: hypothetical protein CVU05_12015 [Bacteroidetes bacterium HGW-Bacteroidetes-21]